LLIAFSINSLYSQSWHEFDGKNADNFLTQRDQFLKDWGNKDITQKGNGWKAFKRWEWFWEPRVGATGYFPNSYETFRNTQKARYNDKKTKDKPNADKPWSLITPYVNTDSFQGTGRINVATTNPLNSNDVYVGAAAGGLWVSHDGGTNWSSTTDELGSIGVSDIVIDYNNTNTIYIATGDRDHSDTRSIGVMKSIDGGMTWNATGLVFNTSSSILVHKLLMHPGSSNILLAATSNGVYITTDAGTTWNRTFTSSAGDMAFNPGDPQIIYMVNSTRIYKSVNGGYIWTQVTTGLPTTSIQRIKLGVTPANVNFVYAIYSNSSSGYLGTYLSTNNGDTWTSKSTTPNILGWSPTGSDTGGQGWYDLAIACSQTNPDLLYIGGINVWYSTNGGSTWTYFNNNMHVDIHHLYFIPGTDILYCGNDGGIYRKNTGVNTWTWLGASLPTTQYYCIGTSETNGSMIMGGAQDNGTKLYTSSTVAMVYGGDGMECAIDPTNSSIMYACYQSGGLGRSTNGGTSFTSIAPSTSGAWVTPYMLNPQKSSTIYSGYTNIYKSTNRGTNWAAISNFGTSAGMNFIQVAPSDSNYIYTGRYTGFFKRTTNGGTTWTDVPYPGSFSVTYLAISDNDPNQLYCSVSGYTNGSKVFYSTNGGTVWTNISTGIPNVPCNTIVYQKNSPNRIFVGTDIGVYYKDDFSTTWKDYNINLPNVPVNELEINYISSKLKAATFGRGMWQVALPDARLYPELTGNDSVCCKSINVYHTNYSNQLAYQWAVTNGTIIGSSTLDSVRVQWNTQSKGTLRIAQFNIQYNIRDTTFRDFTLFSLPSPSIDGENVVCCGDTIRYSITTEPGSTYKWKITNCRVIGATNLNYVNVIWGDSCSNQNFNKNIKVIQTNISGCTDSTALDVIINPAPIATIQGPLTVCEKHDYIYKADYNVDYIYSWKVKGGTLKLLSDDMINVAWDSTATGQIDLTISNSLTGCLSKFTKSVIKEKAPNMTITGLNKICINQEGIFTTPLESKYAYVWNSKNGNLKNSETNSCIINWAKSGKDTITLVKTSIYNACSDTSHFYVEINSLPDVKIAGPENTYKKTSSTYSNTVAANETLTWKIENGTILNKNAGSVTVYWGNATSGKVSLRKENSQTTCIDSNVLIVKLTDYFVTKLTGSNSACQGDTIEYTNNVVGMASNWTISNGKILSQSTDKIKVIWDQLGNGELTLIVSQNSVSFIDTAKISVTVNPNPVKPTITKSINYLTSSADVGNYWYKKGNLVNISTGKIFYPTEDGTYYAVVVDPTTKCKSPASNEVIFDYFLSIDDNNSDNFKILPNPNNGNFKIVIPEEFRNQKLRITLSDILGNSFVNTESLNSESSFINIKPISGVYILRIYSDEKMIYQNKIMINK
jgi:photosystem II stability/assembly factor-like uncharacterized protein